VVSGFATSKIDVRFGMSNDCGRPHDDLARICTRLAEGSTDILVSGAWARRDNRFTTALAGRVVAPEVR
jgi:hypothetical protein